MSTEDFAQLSREEQLKVNGFKRKTNPLRLWQKGKIRERPYSLSKPKSLFQQIMNSYKVLESKSWIKNIDFNPSFAEVHSLTGGKKAKWKFQDSFYGNFNVGRRPSQDTAWGRRYKVLPEILMFYCLILSEFLTSMRSTWRSPSTATATSAPGSRPLRWTSRSLDSGTQSSIWVR